MHNYHISYIINNANHTLIGDFTIHLDYEITSTTFSDFKTCVASELECAVENLVILSFIEIDE